MLRSMYSGISGMKNSQVKLDVIGNNISNVNTYGFKKGRVTFKDMVSQSISGASEANAGMGGTNAKQVGLGSQIGSIDTIHTQGSLQTTGRVLDLAISGDGFFKVRDGNNTDFYTRAGNFYVDADSNLVTGDGLKVIGITPAAGATPATVEPIYIDPVKPGSTPPVLPTDPPQPKLVSLSVGADGTISAIYDGDTVPTTLSTIQVTKFSNNEGLEKYGGNLYIVSSNSGAPVDSTPGKDGNGALVSGALEMSNVDLSEEFTEMIVAQRSFQANTRIITTSDEILQELVNLKR